MTDRSAGAGPGVGRRGPGLWGVRVLALAVLAAAITVIVLAAERSSRREPGGLQLAGVHVHALWYPVDHIPRSLDAVVGLGANVVRVDVQWALLEPAGKRAWSAGYRRKLDVLMAGARARRLGVIVDLWGSPCWASRAPATLKRGCRGAWWRREVDRYPPRDPADYADVVRRMTARYGPTLAGLELWNEPNLEGPGDFFRTGDKPGDYARLVRVAYPAAKAGNPDVPVLAGALAGADLAFLRALYARGLVGFHDGISVHPYNGAVAPVGTGTDGDARRQATMPGLQRIIEEVAARDTDTRVWITELGWTTCAPRGDPRWCVSERAQASYLRGALALLAEEELVEAAVIYNLRNKGIEGDDVQSQFGLLRFDYARKPAYEAVRRTFGRALARPS